MNRWLCALVASGLLWAPPTLAQQTQPPPELKTKAGTPFAHRNSGVSLPAMAAGLTRARVLEFVSPELDVAGIYQSDAGDELTVYVYHSTAASLPVWFDRATDSILSRGTYGVLTEATPTQAFSPRPGLPQTGMMAAWSAQGRWRGTGLAIFGVGNWMVKLRYSSATLDGQAVTAKLREALDALGLPKKLPDGPVATPVVACSDKLTFGAAKDVANSGDAAILLAALSGVEIKADKADEKAAPVVWCRDAAVVPQAAIYRPGDSATAYAIAFADAGRAAVVSPSLAGLLGGKDTPAWSVSFIQPGVTTNFNDQDALPSPERTVAIIDGPPQSQVRTVGKSQITLGSDFGKK